jgi:ribonuclease-3
VFVDGGFEGARDVISRLFEPVLKVVDPKTLGKDSKTLLQEYLQAKRLPLPVYTVVETRGAAHNQEFEVECSIPKLDVGVRGNGRSRRGAEQSVAADDEVAPERARPAAPAPAAEAPAAKAAPALEAGAAEPATRG